MATVMESDPGWKPRAQFGHPQLGDQKIGEFPGAGGHLGGQRRLRGAGEEVGVENLDHRPAGTRANDHRLGVL